MKNIISFVTNNILYIALITALSAMVGSLYFSEIKEYAPCILCWYQRILMFPLVSILAVGIYRRDKAVDTYVLPLSIMGMIISFYHVLLQYGVVSENLGPCVLGQSCTTPYGNYFGFITIPLLSFSAFAVLTFFMLVYKKQQK